MKANDRYYAHEEDLRFPPLTEAEELDLARKVRAGDAAARELFITRHLLFVLKLGQRFCGSRLPVNETTSAANDALMMAVDRFDPERGFRFRSFLIPYIRAAIARCWRSRAPFNFKHDAPPIEVPLDAPHNKTHVEMTEPSTIEQDDYDGFLKGELAACAETLPPREKEIIRLHYIEGFNLSEIGKRLEPNISRERVRQIHDGILQSLKAHLEKRGVKRSQ